MFINNKVSRGPPSPPRVCRRRSGANIAILDLHMPAIAYERWLEVHNASLEVSQARRLKVQDTLIPGCNPY